MELLERDEGVDGVVEGVEGGERVSGEEEWWVDGKVDGIDELMEKVGVCYEDEEEEEEEEKEEEMMGVVGGK